MSRSDFVSVTIVTYNSGRFIKRCLESVLDQEYPFKEIIVIDNNSTDGTIDMLEPFEDRCRIVYNEEKSASPPRRIRLSRLQRGMGTHPQSRCSAPAGLRRSPGHAGQLDPRVGTVCGKLLTMTSEFDFRRGAGGGFHRNLFHPQSASSGPRQPAKWTTATSATTNTYSARLRRPHFTGAR